MKNIVVTTLISFSGLVLASPTQENVVDAQKYIQAFMTPMIVEICDNKDPVVGGMLRAAGDSWMAKNRESAERGKVFVYAAEEGETREAKENNMEYRRSQIRKEMEALPLPDLKKRCSAILAILSSE